MSDDYKIEVKRLRNEVQSLRDELAIMKRKYEDIIYNLDTDNFSSRFVKEQGDMKTAIKITAKGVESKVSKEEMDAFEESILSQTSDKISATVKQEMADSEYVTNQVLESRLELSSNGIYAKVEETYETKTNAETSYSALSSEISMTSNRISAVINGEHTGDLLNNYLTGIEITPNHVKMLHDNVYSTYNSEGLRFYDKNNQVEGWAIEPNSNYGGMLNYYVNDVCSYSFGAGISGEGYSNTDMLIKANNGSRGRFVVDVTSSGYSEVKFVGLNDNSSEENEPRIYANNELLATQAWVLANAGSGGNGTAVAVFG